ncbi:hypothetical protein EV424DRAFT_1350229 [Suillus variegatus]|nr:hypothetical protein EV424DRAFT_1350229 [Suillus variegatus]
MVLSFIPYSIISSIISSSSEDAKSPENEFTALCILLNDINILIPPDKEMCFPNSRKSGARGGTTSCISRNSLPVWMLDISKALTWHYLKRRQPKIYNMKIIKEAASLSRNRGAGWAKGWAEVNDVLTPLSHTRRARKSILPVSSASKVEIMEVQKVSKITVLDGSRITQGQMKLESRLQPYVLVPSLKCKLIQLDNYKAQKTTSM